MALLLGHPFGEGQSIVHYVGACNLGTPLKNRPCQTPPHPKGGLQPTASWEGILCFDQGPPPPPACHTVSGNAMHAVRTQCARSAKFWMSANTRTLVLGPFHKFLVPYQGFFGFPSIWDVAYLNCQPFPPRRGPSTKCTPSTQPGCRRRHCRHCSEPRIRRGGSIRPAEYSSGQIVRAPKPWSTSR